MRSSRSVVHGKLFERPRWTAQWFRTNWDVAPDGEHFVVIRSLAPSPRRIHVITNWAESLKAIAPSR